MILVILAAGQATRYGTLKQLEGFGPSGELLLDYAIYDALQAGFAKVILVIRRDIEAIFKEKMSEHYSANSIKIVYAFQQEPLGIADAVRSALSEIDAPFAVVNADDYYGGIEVYKQAYDFMNNMKTFGGCELYGVIAYPVALTLSEHGKVSRGICLTGSDGRLLRVEAQFDFEQDGYGKIKGKNAEGEDVVLPDSSLCSMGFWIFPQSFGQKLERDFQEYMMRPHTAGRVGEFHLDSVVQKHIDNQEASVKVIPVANAHWCGVTHPGDKESVCLKLQQLHERGRYSRLRR